MISGQYGGFVACRAHLPTGSDPVREANDIIEHVGNLWQPLNENQQQFDRIRAVAVEEAALDVGDLVNRARIEARLLTVDTDARPDGIIRRVGAVSFGEALGWTRNDLRREQARVVIVRPSATTQPETPRIERPLRLGFHGALASRGEIAIPIGHNVTDVAHPVGAARAITRQLPSGLLVTILRRPGAPTTTMILGFHASPAPQEDLAIRAAFLSGHSARGGSTCGRAPAESQSRPISTLIPEPRPTARR
jgi:hypothetical protein